MLLFDHLPWLLLGTATVTALIRPAWGIWVAFSAIVTAGITGVVTPWYAVLVALGAYLLHFTCRLPTAGIVSIHVGVILYVLASGFHLIPGTESLIVISDYQKTADSAPYTLGFSFDKTLAPLALMILMPSMVSKERRDSALLLLSLVVIGGIVSTLSLAWAMDLIKPAFAVPTWTGLFILKMICYTTFAEEVFFRGYLQNLLTARWGSTIGIVVAAMVFGVAHAGSGFLYVGLASLAGLVYSLSYHLSGRLWVPVAVHTLLNTAHLILFTYPMAI